MYQAIKKFKFPGLMLIALMAFSFIYPVVSEARKIAPSETSDPSLIYVEEAVSDFVVKGYLTQDESLKVLKMIEKDYTVKDKDYTWAIVKTAVIKLKLNQLNQIMMMESDGG